VRVIGRAPRGSAVAAAVLGSNPSGRNAFVFKLYQSG
jgi:hypothetical protein